MAENFDYLSPSSDYAAMAPYWSMVETLLEGASAVRKVEAYLPQFPNESLANYKYRLKNAKFTNIYRDVVENLAAKPFTKEVRLTGDDYSPAIKALVEDVDGSGNHLHAFATTFFFRAVNDAIDWILVDYPSMPEGATLADERASGARPFWVEVRAQDMLAVYSAPISGQEQFVYARIREISTELDDNEEITVTRVRILVRDPITDEETGRITGYAPARFELWEQGRDDTKVWSQIDSGQISIGAIALVPMMTGRRAGRSWRVLPPMKDVAELQIEHYQAETNLKMAKELTAFPMLTGNGVTPPMETYERDDGTRGERPQTVPIGPAAVLYAPASADGDHGEWKFIEPGAQSLKFLSEEIDKTEDQMRELGRMPMTAGTSGITQIAAALQSQKASSAIQAWAWLLKDALERAFKFTAMWLGETIEPTVFVNTQIAIDLGNDKVPDTLRNMRKDGDLSQHTYWEQMRERGVLSQEFDSVLEETRLIEEMPSGDGADALDAVVPAADVTTELSLDEPPAE